MCGAHQVSDAVLMLVQHRAASPGGQLQCAVAHADDPAVQGPALAFLRARGRDLHVNPFCLEVRDLQRPAARDERMRTQQRRGVLGSRRPATIWTVRLPHLQQFDEA